MTEIPSSHTHYLILTAHFWGMSDTEEKTMRALKSSGGSEMLKRYGYVIYKVHSETIIDDIGNFIHKVGMKPIIIKDAKKK